MSKTIPPKLPAFQFYPGDWMKDPALRACSLPARGLWFEMICLMHECEVRGHLSHPNGEPFTNAQIGRISGVTETEIENLLAELGSCGVLSRGENGVIYSRRMVRDEKVRKSRADNGKKGGRPNKEKTEIKANHKPNDNQSGKLKVPPSSSSSSSDNPFESLCAFEEFWIAYPRKRAKVDAEKAWKKLAPDRALVDTLLSALEAVKQTPDWQKDAGQFVPYPATWLNRRGWEDELSSSVEQFRTVN